MRELLHLLLAACLVFWVGRAEAATVAVLQPASDSAAVNEALFRLKGELLAVNFIVAIIGRPAVPRSRDTASPEALAWFERMSDERGIDAFVDVVGDGASVVVDVWICLHSPDRLRASRVALEPKTENAPTALAIRTIEVLRSSFLVLDLAGSSRRAAVVVAPERARKPSPQPERDPRLELEAGVTLLTSLGGVAPALLPLARLDWALRPYLALRLTGAGFGTQPHVETAAGSVDVAQQFGLLGLCVCAASGLGLHPTLAFSMGTLHTSLDGHGSAPNLGHQLDQWALLLDASVGARWGFLERFYLNLATHIQVAEPHVGIYIADAIAAKTGRPNLLLALTVGARL
ncbi:MAG: hypothetical protein ABIQ16_10005 [Polyangiaceae bacterium]